jgi:outer membrane protein assembly factor BamB
VADGAVFIGSNTGWFYKLNETTGAVLAQSFIGYQPKRTCDPMGVIDTATVAPDPATGDPTVYVGGPDGYLYALSAADLALKWKSLIAAPSAKVNDYFEYASPTVANGKIYIGIASNCDDPLVRGAVLGYDQETGRQFGSFYTVPSGDVGGAVWSSVAVAADGQVFATTGNGPPGLPELAYSESIIKLSPDLQLLAQWQVPRAEHASDGDFGASPTLFGGSYVGACNKNGVFYALNRSTMTLAWELRVGASESADVLAICSGSAAYNRNVLYIGSTGATIGGTAYRGTIDAVTPAGKLAWQIGLPEGVTGSPSVDGGGVVAVGTFDNGTAPNGTYLLNADTGKILTVLTHGLDFAQSTFADGWLFTANDSGVYAWAP